MQLIGTEGEPTKSGPDPLAATLGSLVTFRSVEVPGAAAHSSVATTSRKLGAKPLGSAHCVHVPALLRSQSVPVVVATYRLGVAPEKPPWYSTAEDGKTPAPKSLSTLWPALV